MSELLTAVNQMKEQITQMSDVITLLCEKRSENEDESSWDNIGKIIESIEENKDIKKVTEVASRIVKTEKEAPTKVVEASQGEEYDPRIVAFSNFFWNKSKRAEKH